MELTYGGRRAELPAHKDGKDGTPARRTVGVYAFWVVLEGGTRRSPITVLSAEGKEAIALFSGEEEARMFCHLRAEEGTNATIRRTTAGEVLSLMYCPWSAQRVALDPFPGALGERFLGLLILSRARFARRFAGLGLEPVVRAPGIDPAGRALHGAKPFHALR